MLKSFGIRKLSSCLRFCLTVVFFNVITIIAFAQCASGYSQAYLNWDMQYTNGGFIIGTTGTRFALGVNDILIKSSGTVTSNGQNGTHTGTAGVAVSGAADPTSNYDAQFNIGNGVLTFTFTTEVKDLSFTVKDIDNGAALTVTAVDASGNAQNINLTALGTTTLTITNNNTVSARAAGGGAGVASSSNNASVTVLVNNAVKTITLTFTRPTANDIWLSDIKACVYGAHVLNYQSVGTPESGEPEYFLYSNSNNIHVVNATSGAATVLYTDASLPDGGAPYTGNGVNSLAYDPYNQIIYYTSQSISASNKSIFKYDVKTDTKSTWVSDVTAAPFNMEIPANGGLGSGAATFYNGAFYLGIEATVSNEEAGFYRFTIDASGNAVSACRVFVCNGFASAQNLGYGDFIAIDTIMYISDNAGVGGLRRINLDNQTQTNNYGGYDGQLSVSANGTLRFVNASNQFAMYTGSGNWGATTNITGFSGNIVNDAAEVFKYPSDYGDAPSNYGTAYHRYKKPSALTVKLGTTVDYEVENYSSNTSNLDDSTNTGVTDDEDAVSSFSSLNVAANSYAITVAVANTSGAVASAYAWIDFDQDGIFETTERAGASGNIANNATSITLTWSGITNLVVGKTYVRIRIGSTNAEVNVPSGMAANGEVEDYSLYITYNISGTIFDDAGGHTDNIVNGIAMGNPSNSSLYVNLVDSVTNKVKAYALVVPATGVFTLSDIDSIKGYKLMLSISQGVIGADPPVTQLPTNWEYVGDNYGTGNSDGSGNQNGTADGILYARSSGSNISAVKFGIDMRPVAYDKSYNNQDSSTFNIPSGNINYPYKALLTNVSGTSNIAVSGSTAAVMPGKLSGSDFEDGNYSGSSGTNKLRTLVITSLPNASNDLLAYNNGRINVLLVDNPTINDSSYVYWSVASQRYEIPQFNDTALSVFIKKNGHTSLTFYYTWLDSAGVLGTTASYTIGSLVPLPVKLINFDAELINDHVMLHWRTASELNADRFVVERSTDGENFRSVITQKATGTSTSIVRYEAKDDKILELNAVVLYYRLITYDLDQTFEKSEVKVVHLLPVQKVKVWPTPFVDAFSLSVELLVKEEVTFVLFDGNGKELINKTVLLHKGINMLSEKDFPSITPGYYILVVKTEENWLRLPIIKM